MFDAMEVSALVRVDDGTKMTFLNSREGELTEFTFDRDGLILTVTEQGLGNLAEVVNAAVRDRQAKNARRQVRS